MSETRHSAVFFIRELLEPILLQTNFRTIILAQCVCRFWKSLMEDSHDLQVAIWLKPHPKNRLCGEISQPRLNPLIDDSSWGFVPRGCPCVLELPSQAAQRSEASWRHMLVTQPPWKDIAIMKLRSSRIIDGNEGAGSTYTMIRHDGYIDDPFRLGQLYEDQKCVLPRTDIMWHVMMKGRSPVGLDLDHTFPQGFASANIILTCEDLSYLAQPMGSEQVKEEENLKLSNIERWLQSVERRAGSYRTNSPSKLGLYRVCQLQSASHRIYTYSA
ncbi:hypothetical protein BDW74DRAFT_179867 [Aspergillus multicolor]|uniref:uncharacterized protein n=1 Tax=Aspergillus multicolor TaxID=41759 RepID=UPI003CCD0825